MRVYRILRREGAVEEAFPLLERGLEGVHERSGLLFAYSYTEEASDADVHIWRERTKGKGLLRLVEDYGVPARYLMIETVTEEEAAMIDEELSAHLPFLDLEKLEHEAATRPAQDPGALVRLAIAAQGNLIPSVRSILERALHDNNPEVRETAAMAAAVTRRPEFVPRLQELYETENDEEVRAFYAQAIRDCGGTPE